jgi:sarcosine oxidase subunit alpha
MPARRLGSNEPLVTLTVDGDDIPAIAGEPIAVSLYAANRLVLGRSVKYHRPRGAACFAGRCDGCLMRVDGVPSVRTCRTEARAGCEIETQNVLGSAGVDLLAAADWFFPGGMNHHEMFTWARPVNRAMQEIARRVAGIGTLPDEIEAPTPVERLRTDVLVIGGGVSGLACASALAARGVEVLVLEEEARHASTSVLTRSPCVALGIYDETDGRRVVLASTREHLVVVEPRTIVIAQGRAETTEAFEGNDKPGILSLEAAERLFAHHVLPGSKPVIAGEGERVDQLTALFERHGAKPVRIARDELRRAIGRSSVRTVETKSGQKHACDVLVVHGRSSACFELAAQAGVEVRFEGDGFSLVASRDDGATRHPSVFVVGGAAGIEEREAILQQAARVAARIASRHADV